MKEPNTNSNAYFALKPGASFLDISQTGPWCYVKVGNTYSYLLAEYTTFTNPDPSNTNTSNKTEKYTPPSYDIYEYVWVPYSDTNGLKILNAPNGDVITTLYPGDSMYFK